MVLVKPFPSFVLRVFVVLEVLGDDVVLFLEDEQRAVVDLGHFQIVHVGDAERAVGELGVLEQGVQEVGHVVVLRLDRLLGELR